MKHRLLWHFFLQLQLLVRILEISDCYEKYTSYRYFYRGKKPPNQNHDHQIAGQKLSSEQFYFQLTRSLPTKNQELNFNSAASEPGTTAQRSTQCFPPVQSTR